MSRVAINIDIEGFSKIYTDRRGSGRALGLLKALMDGIYQIGEKCFSSDRERIFAHQLGDGFVITSGYGDRGVEKALAISLVLMRHVMESGGATKVAICHGDLADIKGCYPDSIRRNRRKTDGAVQMGKGLMTTFPVMGTALINSITLADEGPSGSLLIVEDQMLDSLPESIEAESTGDGMMAVDWVHSFVDEVGDIYSETNLDGSQIPRVEENVATYINQNELGDSWISNTRHYLNLD